ncbi:MAG: LppM family (lipo)protein [Galactobacter sp.]
MKRFLKALPLLLVGGIALTACGSVDVDLKVKDEKTADLSVSVEAPKSAVHDFVEKQLKTQQEQQGASGDVKVPEGYTAGYFLDSNMNQFRPTLGAASKVTYDESNKGKVMEATQTLHDIDLAKLADAGQSTQVPLSVGHDDGRYSLNFTPSAQMFKEVEDATFTVHFPQAVESASAGGEVHGHSVSWDLKNLKDGQTVTAISEGPGLAWWASLLIWLAGIAVTVLLLVLALLPSGKPKPGEDAPAAA